MDESRRSDASAGTVKDAWQAFSRRMAEVTTDFYPDERLGLSGLQELEDELGLKLHPDLREYLSGCSSEFPDFLSGGSADGIPGELSFLRQSPGALDPSWIPISEGRGNEFFALDNNSGEILFVRHELGGWKPHLASLSLAKLLEDGTEALQEGDVDALYQMVQDFPYTELASPVQETDQSVARESNAVVTVPCPDCQRLLSVRLTSTKYNERESGRSYAFGGADEGSEVEPEFCIPGAWTSEVFKKLHCSYCQAPLEVGLEELGEERYRLHLKALKRPIDSFREALAEIEQLYQAQEFDRCLERMEHVVHPPEASSDEMSRWYGVEAEIRVGRGEFALAVAASARALPEVKESVASRIGTELSQNLEYSEVATLVTEAPFLDRLAHQCLLGEYSLSQPPGGVEQNRLSLSAQPRPGLDAYIELQLLPKTARVTWMELVPKVVKGLLMRADFADGDEKVSLLAQAADVCEQEELTVYARGIGTKIQLLAPGHPKASASPPSPACSRLLALLD